MRHPGVPVSSLLSLTSRTIGSTSTGADVTKEDLESNLEPHKGRKTLAAVQAKIKTYQKDIQNLFSPKTKRGAKKGQFSFP